MEIRARTKVGYNHWILSYVTGYWARPSAISKINGTDERNGKSLTGYGVRDRRDQHKHGRGGAPHTVAGRPGSRIPPGAVPPWSTVMKT
eukprot:7236495-Prymnesium_polylepis.1